MSLPTIDIAETEGTPRIYLNPSKGLFGIQGRSYPAPQTLELFYEPIINWLKEYAKKPNAKTEFVFDLEYFNTASTKMILMILEVLAKIPNTHVIWYGEPADFRIAREFEDMCEISIEWKLRQE
jgi:SiaC family regulatory phosphoprotein